MFADGVAEGLPCNVVLGGGLLARLMFGKPGNSNFPSDGSISAQANSAIRTLREAYFGNHGAGSPINHREVGRVWSGVGNSRRRTQKQIVEWTPRGWL